MADSCPGDCSCNSLCLEECIVVFLVLPADFVNDVVQFPRCCSCLLFTLLSPLLMQILVSRGVRIAIISGSSLDDSLRWSFSLSSAEVSFCIATISNSESLVCWGPPNFPQHRSYLERNTQLNTFVLSDNRTSNELETFTRRPLRSTTSTLRQSECERVTKFSTRMVHIHDITAFF